MTAETIHISDVERLQRGAFVPSIPGTIRSIDRDRLREQVRRAQPFPHFCIDGFLEPAFAEEVHDAFPTFEGALEMGRQFKAVNERRKVQICDSHLFPAPIARLHEALASQDFLDLLSDVFAIPRLLADPELVGGGIHMTGPHGWLDVHTDFNFIPERALHRRLNILVYFNKDWRPEWGGALELWDEHVKVCHHTMQPAFNRCVVFATSEISNHGVTPLTCPEDRVRQSFAAYYYTAEPPEGWDGTIHSTVFKARPSEKLKGHVLMPVEHLMREARSGVQRLRSQVKKVIKPDGADRS
jgi:hypothetical protein